MKYIFKHLMKFENYHQKKVDEILDKISSSGIKSLSDIELDYLKAYGEDNQMKMLNLEYEFGLKDFKSNDGYFEFTFSHMEEFEDGDYYYGVITVPDLYWQNGKRLVGKLEGYILLLPNGDKVPVFERDGYDILEFCNGLEYELDNFIDYIIETLNDEDF